MMKKTRRIALALVSALTLTSCGLVDMEDQEELPLTEMHLQRDTLYLMVGDQFTLQPVLTPDSVTIDDVFWSSSADSVLSISNNVFTGVSEGWSLVRALSVSRQLEDSCHVCVMRRWENTEREYPYEMMVYANVSVHGQPFNPETMVLGAFVDDEMRGAGQLMEWKGKQYVRFRIGSDIKFIDSEGIEETVTFRVYYKQQLRYEEFPQELNFDGEAHGTLSSLFSLSL